MSFYELIVHAVEDSIKSLNAIWKKLGLTESERENQNILFRKHLDEFLLVELEQAKIEFNKKKEALSAQQKQCIDIAERLEESIDSFYRGEDKIEDILNNEDKSINDKLNAFQPMLERLVEKEASLKVLFQQNRNELLKMQEKFGDLNATNKSVFDCNKPVSKKLLKELLEQKQLISKKIKKEKESFEVLAKTLRNKLKRNLLEEKEMTEFDKKVLTGKVRFEDDFRINSEIRKRIDFLEIIENKLKRKKEVLRAQIENLTSQLKVKESDEYKNMDDWDVKELERYTKKLNEALSKQYEEKISRQKTKIDSMFTSMRIPQENRLQLLEETKFKSKKEEYSSLVKLHLKLEELATVSSKISRLMNRRASVIALRSKLDDKNPNRFKIPGRLIKEERIRNKVANLPKLTEQIKRLVGEFESVCGQDFLWKGKPLREIILEFERAEREAQERERVELEQRRIRRKSGGFKAAFGTPLKKRALKRPQSASVLKIHSKLRKNNDYKKIEKSVETKKHLKQISNTPISLS